MVRRRRLDIGREGSVRLEALARTVRARREALELRQLELADLAGCSSRFVHSLENAKPTVQLDKVLDVLAVLGLDLQVVPGSGQIRGRRP